MQSMVQHTLLCGIVPSDAQCCAHDPTIACCLDNRHHCQYIAGAFLLAGTTTWSLGAVITVCIYGRVTASLRTLGRSDALIRYVRQLPLA